jgi:flagellar biosynthesis/type III secretory pathway protein FliH
MCLTEYDEARTLAEERADGYDDGKADGIELGILTGRREGREEGLKEGETIGLIKTLSGLVSDGILTIEQAASRAGMTVGEFKPGFSDQHDDVGKATPRAL